MKSRAAVLAAAAALAAGSALPAGAAGGAPPIGAEELRTLAARMMPRPLLDGFAEAFAQDAADRAAARVPREREAEVRVRARAAAEEVAGRALPEAALVDFTSGLLRRHYDDAELRELASWYRSELATKVEAWRREAATVDARARDPEAAAKEKAALAERRFTPDERRRAEAFARSAVARKAAGLAPELTAAYLEFVEARIEPERAALERRVDALVAAASPPLPAPAAE